MAYRKRELVVSLCAIVLCALQWTYSAWAGSAGAELRTLAPLVKHILPSVVSVMSTRHVADSPRLVDPGEGFPEAPLSQSINVAGSGVVLDAALGLVVTTIHVIDHAEAITVALADGLRVNAKVVTASPRDDLAILRIFAPGLTEAALSEPNKVEAGDFVLAVGNPLGLGQITTFGIIGALHAAVPGIENTDLVATDAVIDQGSSGGALINARGELVGVIVAQLGHSGGFGFAVSVNAVRALLDRARLRLS
jgi:S1-C subfamily serine protease